MPSYAPTVTINTSAGVVVTCPNLSYEELINSLGNYAYIIDEVYIGALGYNQVSGVVSFNYLDATGKQRFVSVAPTIDPNQFQPKVYYDVREYDILINGNSQLSFNLLPNELVSLTFYARRVSNQDELSGNNNFQNYEVAQDKPRLFEDWVERI